MPPPRAAKDQQEIAAALIEGLEKLAVVAENAAMGPALRIFFTAKEELVHWMVTMRFHESAEDRFINRHLYAKRPAARRGMRD